MSTITTILTSIVGAFTTNSDSDNGPSGANAVRTAVTEIENLRDREFTATLGEPDVEEEVGRYFNDPKVVIPIRDAPFDGVNRLVFDLPEGRDDELSTFNDLLDLFNLGFEEMERLDGEEVPMTFIGGNTSVIWDEIEREEEDDEEDDEDESDESAVTVENETISADE